MSFKKIEQLRLSESGVAVALTDGALGEGHIGLVFRDEDKKLRILHLGWHHRLMNDSAPDLKGCWVARPIQFSPMLSKRVAAYLMTVARLKQLINYGVAFRGIKNSFKADGRYDPPKDSDGLTCATFIVAVMDGCSVNIVDLDSWPETEENREWGLIVHKELKRTNGVSEEHLEAVLNNITGLRVTPFEVGGSFMMTSKDWPSTFKKVGPFGKIAKEQLVKFCPLPKNDVATDAFMAAGRVSAPVA